MRLIREFLIYDFLYFRKFLENMEDKKEKDESKILMFENDALIL